ncbi:hypothetical protein [Actinomadura fibrosa]|uniref:Uncharacterized protein n=1 Tax=Actinomadura fibrosa TaxID=111802 RepID=A0ABW2Y5D0_9ACTN|nr:hypothetical protein [Actinomadura fibrosa]
MLATVMADPVLANTAPRGTLFGLWLIPVVVVLGLLVRFPMLTQASSRKLHPKRRRDQDNHRGAEQGGFYAYTPGMYSHSYPPGEVKYEDGEPGTRHHGAAGPESQDRKVAGERNRTVNASEHDALERIDTPDPRGRSTR